MKHMDILLSVLRTLLFACTQEERNHSLRHVGLRPTA